MADQFITCPSCGKRIPVTEAFTRQIEARVQKETEAELKRKDREHEAALAAKLKEYDEKLARERLKVEARARKKAEENLAVELKDLKEQLDDKAKKLDTAQRHELTLRRRTQELEERERHLKLEVQRTLDQERKKIQEDAVAKATEEHHLNDKQKDLQLTEMRKQIEDLKRKAEQGSQQAQGEVLEVEIEQLLRAQFRADEIEPVAKGTRGADALQRVYGPSGQRSGTILWESKRTKNWSDVWVPKLKDDQREARADIAVIVSTILPKEVKRIGYIDGIWVSDVGCVVGLATALRASLIQVAQARSALMGKAEKMDLLYNYLSGSEFRQRVEGIVESFVSMQEDLEAEKRVMERQWAKREKQIQRVVQSTTGMYGDLQGMIGAALPHIHLLELPWGTNSESSGGDTSDTSTSEGGDAKGLAGQSATYPTLG